MYVCLKYAEDLFSGNSAVGVCPRVTEITAILIYFVCVCVGLSLTESWLTVPWARGADGRESEG